MMRNGVPLICLGALLCLAAAPPSEQPAFPGQGEPPRTAADASSLMAMLYGARDPNDVSYRGGEACRERPCPVRLLAQSTWTAADGEARWLLVMAAEPIDAPQATEALLGIAQLRHDAAGWVLEAGSPVVAEAGSYGIAPQATIVDAGSIGRGVATIDSDMHQGVAESGWDLYLPVAGHFTRVLALGDGKDSSGQCSRDDAACWRAADPLNFHLTDYAAAVAVIPDAAGGVDVSQVITSLPPGRHVEAVKRWHIDGSGTVQEQSGGR